MLTPSSLRTSADPVALVIFSVAVLSDRRSRRCSDNGGCCRDVKGPGSVSSGTTSVDQVGAVGSNRGHHHPHGARGTDQLADGFPFFSQGQQQLPNEIILDPAREHPSDRLLHLISG